jgi:allantoate deiminase
MLGSHLDTVRDAGKYDGMLGVISAIECVAALHAAALRLPFAIEVVGFGDEEGVRFGSTLLGSRAVAGTFDPALLEKTDANGTTMRDALREFGLDPAQIPAIARRPQDVLAYAELHIEQGPVLESQDLATGVVTAINGGNRFNIELTGMAGHAGTVPMALRRDAAAAAECVLAVERIAAAMPEIVGTVGRMEALPGAMNVIPGKVRFSLDVRAPTDEKRHAAVARFAPRWKRSRNAATSRWRSRRCGRPRRRRAIHSCSANSPLPSRRRAGGCITCRLAQVTTAWPSSTLRRSACSSSAARTASATIPRRR